MPLQLVVFDLDGTLVDSLKDLAESANELLVECGAPPLPEDAIGLMVGDGAASLIAKAFAASRQPQPPDALSRFLAIYNSRLLRWTRAYPGIPETLEAMQPRVRLAVLTNKPLGACQRILDGLHLSRFFGDGDVIGGDSAFPRKPNPEGLRYLAKRAAVTPAQTLLVGDSIFDWRTARAAEARAALVRYGFGFRTLSVDEVGTSATFIDRPTDLLGLL